MIIRKSLSKVCPKCNCETIVQEGVETSCSFANKTQLLEIRKHTNGETWDYRLFLCGCKVKWIPNFSKEQIVEDCRKDPEYVEYTTEVAKLKSEIEKLESQMREVSRKRYEKWGS